MKKIKALSFILINLTAFTFLISCTQNSYDLELVKITRTKTMPSGSGIVNLNDNFYAIGDDSPYLYALVADSFQIAFPMSNSSLDFEGRVDKKMKLDFEDIDVMSIHNKDLIIVISSGSKKIVRDSIFVVDTNMKQSLSMKRMVNKKTILLKTTHRMIQPGHLLIQRC